MMYILPLFIVFSFIAIVESTWDDELIREEVRDERRDERKADEGSQM